MANEDIRKAIKKANLTQWKIADFLGISEVTLCRRLRKELPKEEKEEIFELIEKHKNWWRKTNEKKNKNKNTENISSYISVNIFYISNRY